MTRLFRVYVPLYNRVVSRAPTACGSPLPFFALRRLVVVLVALPLGCTVACGVADDGAAGRDSRRAEVAEFLAIVRVVTERVTVLGYDRSLFGGWAPAVVGTGVDAGSGTGDTRDAILAQWFGTADGNGATIIADPYTGDDLTAEGADIDHVYPLAAAWDFGAHQWDARTRRAFANDAERNLVPVASAVNRAKSDLTPAEWLPPNRDLRCDYSARYLRVAVAWRLAVSIADWEAMADACDITVR